MTPSFDRLGASFHGSGTRFRAWAPHAREVELRLFADDGAPQRTLPMHAEADGAFVLDVPEARPGTLYKFVVDGQELPDPYARFLPRGVHGPAEVIADAPPPPRFGRRPLHQLVIYELHVGTFTDEGTYAAAAQRLDDLVALGVTAIELLPLAAFAGHHGWGYDGVAWFAPHAPYGRPDDLRRFVAAAHERGLVVLLDAVYNHFGPSGNYLAAFAPDYFGEEGSAWGAGPNFRHPRLRRAVLDSARHWLEAFGFDGLRLDATHAIVDRSPVHILSELAEVARTFEPPALLIAEDERNDPALVTAHELDAVWADDFHHAVRVLVTGERDGYYAAYEPSAATLARTIRRGWLYEGQIDATSGEPRGKPADGLTSEALVYCIQNHDQIGNRAFGTRLHHDGSLDAFLAATMLLLFLPATPLLFMGQEWAASSPFLYFTDHEPQLGELVSKGRREEFKHFRAFADAAQRARIPDPQDPQTFQRSKLRWSERTSAPHARALALTTTMLRLRREDPVLSAPTPRDRLDLRVDGDWVRVTREAGGARRSLLVCLTKHAAPVDVRELGRVLAISREDADGVVRAPGAILLER